MSAPSSRPLPVSLDLHTTNTVTTERRPLTMSPHAYRGDRALGVSSFFTGIAAVVVLLRLYTRFFIIRYNGIEDYLIALTMVWALPGKILITARSVNSF
jgi:hypothetical protein